MNKFTARKRPINRFRFAPIFQKRIERALPGGGLVEDYQSKGVFFCSKDNLKSMELSLLSSQRIEADFRLEARYTGKVSVADRLLFYDKLQKSFEHRDILRVSHLADPTGRKEYLTIYAASGAYAGQAPVQPEDQNRIILKKLMTAEELRALLSRQPEDATYPAFATLDAWVLGGSENNYIATRGDTEVTAFPVVFTLNTLATVTAKVGADSFDFSLNTLGDWQIWSAPQIQVATGTEKILKFTITEA